MPLAAHSNRGAACVILAAGSSSRMGHPKALLQAGGRTFLERIAGAYREAGVLRCVVVLARPLAEGPVGAIVREQGMEAVVNEAPGLGKWHSIRLGMAAVAGAERCFLQPVDQPGVSPAVLRALLAAPPVQGYAVPVHRGRAGHPLLLEPPVMARLAAWKEDTHLRRALAAFPRQEVPVDDPAVLLNINTPEALAALRAAAPAP